MMGDKATEVDCAMFGILSQCLWNTPGSPFEQLLQGTKTFFFYNKFKNIYQVITVVHFFLP